MSDGVRSFTLWREPVITVAALARLHLAFNWPSELIGTQSSDWAFDVVAFLPSCEAETVAGEVKKTDRELDDLISLMKMYGANPAADEPTGGKSRNAWKKVAALRARPAPLFWAVGPAGYNSVYRVSRTDNDVVRFEPAGEDALRYVPHDQSQTTALASLRELITSDPMPASDGDHGARLWRVAESVRQEVELGDDRLPHILSRIAILCRGLANDLRTGYMTVERAVVLLDRLVKLGELTAADWRKEAND